MRIIKSIRFQTFIVLSALLLGSCEVINPEEPIPSYIHIDKITQEISDSSKQGANSSNFSDAWVFIDDQAVGCYELPCTFPVLLTGSHKIVVKAGIKIDGMTNTRSAYPMLTAWETTANLAENVTTDLSPKVSYFDNMVIKYYDATNILENNFWLSSKDTSSSSAQIVIASDNLVSINQGTYAKMTLDANHTSFFIESKESMTIPYSNISFLELDYKCDYDFLVGLHADGKTLPDEIVGLKSTNGKWKKIYINLIEYVRRNSPGTSSNKFKVYVSSYLAGGATSAEICIDNVKIVYPEQISK